MRARGVPAGSGVAYATIGVIGLAVVCATLVAILVPTLISRKEPAVAGDAAGASLIESNGNGQTVLYPLGAMVGWAWNAVGGALQLQPTGFRSDLDRMSILASINLYVFSLADAEYRYEEFYSDAGTLMFHAQYHLYFYSIANASGVTVIIFSLPDEFRSDPVTDGSATINRYGVFNANCAGTNNLDAGVLPVTAFIVTKVDVFNTYGVPYIRLTADDTAWSAFGMGIYCSIDFLAPVAA